MSELTDAELRALSPITREAALAIEAALSGAIGWIAAGTNEGNHLVARETMQRLSVAAGFFRRLADELPKLADLPKDDRNPVEASDE